MLGHVTYDVTTVRAHFPALAEGAAHFDGPGGSQVPDVVGEAVAATLCAAIANRGSVTAAERRADRIVADARQAAADLLGAQPGGIVFGRSMTQLTYDFSRTLAKTWQAGDEVVVTRLDHDANIRPWVQAAQSRGVTVRWADFDPASGELAVEAVRGLLSDRTRLVAVTAASNLLGTRPDIPAIAAAVHEADALLYVDGVHLTPHAPVDVTALGADFYGCSRTSFAARTSAWSPPRPSCWRPCTRTSWRRRRTRCPSGSSWAPCPMNCSPEPPPRSSSWRTSSRAKAPAGSGCCGR